MLKQLFEKAPELRLFRIRGGASYLHHWSHGVLTLAVILLLSSYLRTLEQANQLLFYLKGLLPLLLTIWLFYRIWREQNTFLLRYDLQDGRTNLFFFSTLLMSILAVFPLRYLVNWLFGHFNYFLSILFFGNNSVIFTQHRPEAIPPVDMAWLLFLFGIGASLFCLLFYLLYDHAQRQGDDLFLSGAERALTAYSAARWMTGTWVAAVSALLALAGLLSGEAFFLFAAGIVYLLIWLLAPVQAARLQRQLKEDETEL